MKKIQILGLLLIGSFTLLTSCKEVKKEEQKETSSEKSFALDANNTSINWIAYKTTSKLPVKGSFAEFTTENAKSGTTVKEVLNNLKFSIPVSSLQTNDTIRDGKLIKYFFGSMENTSKITGKLNINNENSSTAEITMNGISFDLPITYSVNDKTVNIEAVMNLDNWSAQTAIEALNVVCFDLHKGDDGISKTWSEVKIEITANFIEE